MEENDNRPIYSVRLSRSSLYLISILPAHPDPKPHFQYLPLSTFSILRWTAKNGPWPAGDPDLQHYIGELLYKGAVSPIPWTPAAKR